MKTRTVIASFLPAAAFPVAMAVLPGAELDQASQPAVEVQALETLPEVPDSQLPTRALREMAPVEALETEETLELPAQHPEGLNWDPDLREAPSRRPHHEIPDLTIKLEGMSMNRIAEAPEETLSPMGRLFDTRILDKKSGIPAVRGTREITKEHLDRLLALIEKKRKKRGKK